ncbi:MAG: hypothetical protein HYS18_02825 [Burkholderiales bacterium]|nr:hypothetical protein [Burkholderiales bacterium]
MTIEPNFRVVNDKLVLKGTLRVRHVKTVDETSNDISVRELLLTYRGSSLIANIGAQQINWGRMDIVRITDVINPVDTKDLYYEETPEAKKAMWMANLEWQFGEGALQLIASPEASADVLPKSVAGMPLSINKPTNSLRNGTYAARYGFNAASWNVDLIAIRGWNASPTIRLQTAGASPYLVGEVDRMTKLGFSADRPVGPFVVRLEGAYSPKHAYGGIWIGDVQRPSRSTAGVGLDLQTKDWFFAGQVIVDRFSDQDMRGLLPQENTFVSFLAQRKWMQDRLGLRIFTIGETKNHSYWLSLQSTYEINANQEVRIQADRFAGNSTSTFGQIADRSRIAASYRLKY